MLSLPTLSITQAEFDGAGRGAALTGCAGWSIPKLSAGDFPAEGSHLQRYAAVFGAVEINTSFYRPHRSATWTRWADSTPPHFRFSVKLPRAITHEARLVAPDERIAVFAGEVAGLGDKLGCVLVQLPPSLQFDGAIADPFFTAMRQRFAGMLACEARHPSWFGMAASALLREHGVTRVIADPAAGQPGPHEPTSDSIYVRLHGAPRVYYSDYDSAFLDTLGSAIASHVAAGRTVWTIFDNTMSPTFVGQALQVQRVARALI